MVDEAAEDIVFQFATKAIAARTWSRRGLVVICAGYAGILSSWVSLTSASCLCNERICPVRSVGLPFGCCAHCALLCQYSVSSDR